MWDNDVWPKVDTDDVEDEEVTCVVSGVVGTTTNDVTNKMHQLIVVI